MTARRRHTTLTKKPKSTRRRGHFSPLACAPQQRRLFSSCYSNQDLMQIRHVWNLRHPDRPIRETRPQEVWSALKRAFATTCSNESCWVSKLTKNKQLKNQLLDSFAPQSPAEWRTNPNEWLSSVDISNVMKQYEKQYKCFDFLGPSPIDFDTKMYHDVCVWDELCRFSLAAKLRAGIRKCGIIFNLDPHYKDGSHWVSMFIDVPKRSIFYFDSTGDPMPPEVRALAERVAKQGRRLHPPIHFRIDQNHPVTHQRQNTECGMYALYFIIHMLEDKIRGGDLKKRIITDKQMERFRHVFFNKHGTVH